MLQPKAIELFKLKYLWILITALQNQKMNTMMGLFS